MIGTKKFTPKEGIKQISSHSFSIVLKRLKIPEYPSKIEEIPHTLNYDSNGDIYMCIDLTCDSDEDITTPLHNESDEIVDTLSSHVSDLILDEDAPSSVHPSWVSPPYGPYESDDEGVDMYYVSLGAAPDRDEVVTDKTKSCDVGGNASQYEASSISDCKIKISRKKGATIVTDSGAVANTTSINDKLCAVFNALKPSSQCTTASKPYKKRVSHFVRSNENRELEVIERLRRKLHPERRGRPKKRSNEKQKMLGKISTNKVARYHQSNFRNLSKDNRSNHKTESPSVPASSIPNVNSDSSDLAPLAGLCTDRVFNEKAVNLVSEALLSSIKASDEKDEETIAIPKSSIAGVEFPVKDGTKEKGSVPSSSSTSSANDSLISSPPVYIKRSLEALDLAVPVQKKLVPLTEDSAGNLANKNGKPPINSNANSCAIITYQNKIIHTVVLPKVAENSAPEEPSKSHIGTIRVVPLDKLRDPALIVPPPNTTNVAPNVTVLPTAMVERMPKEIVLSTTKKSRAPRKSYKRKLPITNGCAPIKSRKKCDTTETLFIPSNPQNVRQCGSLEAKSSLVNKVADESHVNDRSPSSTYGPWPVPNYGVQQHENHSQHKTVDNQVLPPMYLHQTRRVSQPSPVQQGFSQPSFSQAHFPATQTQDHHRATFTYTPGHHQATFTQTQIHQPTLARIQPPPPYLGNVPTSMMQQQYVVPCQGFQQQQQQQQQQPFIENCGVSAQNPVAAPQLYNQQLPSQSVGYPNGFSPPVANTAPLMKGYNGSETAAVYQHYCNGLSTPQQFLYENANSSVMDESDLIQQITNRGFQDFLKSL